MDLARAILGRYCEYPFQIVFTQTSPSKDDMISNKQTWLGAKIKNKNNPHAPTKSTI